jgi:predicted nucleotide-binding protein (sugar kinase/HSP70/actin superfamily)
MFVDKIKNIMDFLKTTGTTIAMIITVVVWIGKPYADEYIDKRVEDKVKDIAKTQKELTKTVDKLTNVLIMTMDKKQKEELFKLQKEKSLLLGK